MKFLKSIFLGICLGLLAGCANGQTAIPTQTYDPLRPYFTITPSLPAGQTATPTPEVILPTPTPITYVIQKGDTFGAIAQKFGVRLDDLIAANPTVVPEALTVGITIIIPNAPLDAGAPAPTAAPLTVDTVDCWRTLDDGLWCFVPVKNDTSDPLENLIAQVSLVDASNVAVASKDAFAPLDILPSGKSTALAVFFPAPIPEGITAQAKLTTAIRIHASDTRYAQAVAQNILAQVDWNGTSAQVTGTLRLAGENPPAEIPAGRVWIGAVAYDSQGRVVGVRRWESTSALLAGGVLVFDFQVASMGPVIERVDVLVEARP